MTKEKTVHVISNYKIFILDFEDKHFQSFSADSSSLRNYNNLDIKPIYW